MVYSCYTDSLTIIRSDEVFCSDTCKTRLVRQPPAGIYATKIPLACVHGVEIAEFSGLSDALILQAVSFAQCRGYYCHYSSASGDRAPAGDCRRRRVFTVFGFHFA